MRRLALSARACTSLLAALALAGCETTAEKSAELQKQSKVLELAHKGLSITRTSTAVKVVATAALHDSEGAAAVVTVRNDSARTLRSVPIAITVADASGRTVYQNNAPGLEAGLTELPSLAPHAEVSWVDDQLPASVQPAAVRARVGAAPTAPSQAPITVSNVHLTEESTDGLAASATVSNQSAIAQRNLVVFAIARRAGRIVAAGRAVIPELTAGSSAPLQVFFVGDARGAQLVFSAPASTLG